MAILAGQIAGFAASQRGPTGPFEVSVGFLILGGLLSSVLWKENVASNNSSDESNSSKPTIRDAVNEYVTTYQKANKLSVSNISVALSIESKNVPKLRLSGSYCAKDS